MQTRRAGTEWHGGEHGARRRTGSYSQSAELPSSNRRVFNPATSGYACCWCYEIVLAVASQCRAASDPYTYFPEFSSVELFSTRPGTNTGAAKPTGVKPAAVRPAIGSCGGQQCGTRRDKSVWARHDNDFSSVRRNCGSGEARSTTRVSHDSLLASPLSQYFAAAAPHGQPSSRHCDATAIDDHHAACSCCIPTGDQPGHSNSRDSKCRCRAFRSLNAVLCEPISPPGYDVSGDISLINPKPRVQMLRTPRAPEPHGPRSLLAGRAPGTPRVQMLRTGRY